MFEGYLAKVTLHPDRIQIDRRVMGRVNGNHSACISWQHLAGVHFLDPTRLINGHVHFAPAGDPRGLTATGRGNRMAAAARNPHAIMFTWQQRATYERLRDLLTANQVPVTRPAPPAPSLAAVARPILPPQPAASPPQANSALTPPPNQEPAWLPGNVDVQVAGETFHSAAIKEACRSGRPGVPDIAILVPEPGNPHDRNAIAVHVNRFLVGHLPRQVTAAVQPALTAFTARTGRHVACPARIMWHEINSRSVAQIILSLDPAPLGLGSEAFGHLPDLDRVLQQHLSRLDNTAAPAMTGCTPAARSLLADASQFSVPVARRKVGPHRPAASGPFRAEPVLPETQFEQALAVLRNARNALERTPSMTATLDEEKIRDLLLVLLNAQFEGAAAGEVFNASGKTDILIRAEDRNVFIAECKIWKGPKTIQDALSQLLSYLTWRDTKAAFLLFIRKGGPTTIISKSVKEIEGHPNFKRARGCIKMASATTSSCTPTVTRTGRFGWRSCPSLSKTPEASCNRPGKGR